VLDGRLKPLDDEGFQTMWDQESDDLFFLDCRETSDAEELLAQYPGRWHNIPQGDLKQRIDEVPRDKEIVLVCNSGMRSYEAQLNLRELGIDNTRSVEGGMKMLKTWGVDI